MNRKLTSKEQEFLLKLSGLMGEYSCLLSVQDNKVCIDIDYDEDTLESILLTKPVSGAFDIHQLAQEDIYNNNRS